MAVEFDDSIFENPQSKKEPLSTEEITRHLAEKAGNVSGKKSLFVVKTANQWIEEAKSRPIPNMLFSEFWHQGELCILFADTNVGKSILAVQIGNSIASGVPVDGFKMEAGRQKVLYMDFELSDKQFEGRCSNRYKDHYRLDDNLFRVEIDADSEISADKWDQHIMESFEIEIVKHGPKVLIVDNITYLKTRTEKAVDALPLMKHLKALKAKHNLSILALAHTPKRDHSKPIGRNDLSGSKMLINFCDSAFAIGESQQESGVRYLKQIKARNTEVVYDSENVILCEVVKPSNFLMFRFMMQGDERSHLKTPSPNEKEELIFKVKELLEEGKSQRAIAEELEIGLGTVNKYKKLSGYR